MLPTTFFTNSKDIFEILQLREFNLIKLDDNIFSLRHLRQYQITHLTSITEFWTTDVVKSKWLQCEPYFADYRYDEWYQCDKMDTHRFPIPVRYLIQNANGRQKVSHNPQPTTVSFSFLGRLVRIGTLLNVP